MTELKQSEEEALEEFFRVPEINHLADVEGKKPKSKMPYSKPDFECIGNAELERFGQNYEVSGHFEPGNENFRSVLENDEGLRHISNPRVLEALKRKFWKPGIFVEFHTTQKRKEEEKADCANNYLAALRNMRKAQTEPVSGFQMGIQQFSGRKAYFANGNGFIADLDKDRIYPFKYEKEHVSQSRAKELKPKQLEYLLDLAHSGTGQIKVGTNELIPSDYSFSSKTNSGIRFERHGSNKIAHFYRSRPAPVSEWHINHS